MIKPKAILVCVDYSEILALTLPYNRHHFSEVMVVTSLQDYRTMDIAAQNNCQWYGTNSFWEGGASFNKFRAMEKGLDAFGREGWMVIMDADVVWPKHVKLYDAIEEIHEPTDDWEALQQRNMSPNSLGMVKGCLYTPFRRMKLEATFIPPEHEWGIYQRHRQQREFAGYSQIFHADDPVLDHKPWFEQNHTHAGGGDSWFQNKWSEANKIRPDWECLHLGPAGKNWAGTSKESQEKLKEFLRLRRKNRNFEHEMI